MHAPTRFLAFALAAALPMALPAASAAPTASGAPQAASPNQSPSGQGTGGCTLIVHVTGFRNQKGDAGGTIFSSPDGWPENSAKAFEHGPFPIEGDHATLTFQHLPEGRYGLAVIHDENMNHKLDRNFIGIPKEGLGFGNNPHFTLSAPSWNTSAINVTCPTTTTDVALVYYK
ncbi:MAG: DUF2141 domain-containing protein [Acidobacteriaceae bacterium]